MSHERYRHIPIIAGVLLLFALAAIAGMHTDLHQLVAIPLHQAETSFADSVLQLDWTEEQLAAARAGLPIPSANVNPL